MQYPSVPTGVAPPPPLFPWVALPLRPLFAEVAPLPPPLRRTGVTGNFNLGTVPTPAFPIPTFPAPAFPAPAVPTPAPAAFSFPSLPPALLRFTPERGLPRLAPSGLVGPHPPSASSSFSPSNASRQDLTGIVVSA